MFRCFLAKGFILLTYALRIVLGLRLLGLILSDLGVGPKVLCAGRSIRTLLAPSSRVQGLAV